MYYFDAGRAEVHCLGVSVAGNTHRDATGGLWVNPPGVPVGD